MHSILISLISSVLAGFRTRLALQTEILSVRHQIIVLRRSVSSRPKLQAWDRFLWIWLLHLWPQWCSALIIAKPETIIAWHRKGLRPIASTCLPDIHNDPFDRIFIASAQLNDMSIVSRDRLLQSYPGIRIIW